MKIDIIYKDCWGHEKKALRLRDDLMDEFLTDFDSFEINMVESDDKLDFEIIVNDHLQVFSRKQIGRFPNSSYEVIKTIRDAVDERRLG